MIQLWAGLRISAFQGSRMSDMAGPRRGDVLDASAPSFIRVNQGAARKPDLTRIRPRPSADFGSVMITARLRSPTPGVTTHPYHQQGSPRPAAYRRPACTRPQWESHLRRRTRWLAC